MNLPLIVDARADPGRTADPPGARVLACGLAVRYAPEVSQLDLDGQRHRIERGAFDAWLAKGESVPFLDERGDGEPIELVGAWRFVRTVGGLRLEVLDTKIVKTLAKVKGPMGLALRWKAIDAREELDAIVTVRADVVGVAVVRHPAFDGAELAVLRD
jgi:phage head maturation protease